MSDSDSLGSGTIKRYGRFGTGLEAANKYLAALKGDTKIDKEKKDNLISKFYDDKYAITEEEDIKGQLSRQMRLFDKIQSDKEKLKAKEGQETRRNIFAGTLGAIMQAPFSRN